MKNIYNKKNFIVLLKNLFNLNTVFWQGFRREILLDANEYKKLNFIIFSN